MSKFILTMRRKRSKQPVRGVAYPMTKEQWEEIREMYNTDIVIPWPEKDY